VSGGIGGSRHGRAVRLGLLSRTGEGTPRWNVTVDLACESRAFFDIGLQDGRESYAAQLPNPVLRAAIRRLVETHQVESIALNASSPQLPAPYRLRVTIEQATRRPTVAPTAARDILDQADKIAELAER
jgi:hypothetical protein